MLGSLMLSLVVAIILIQVAVFGTTIYLHRTATHRALTLHPGGRLAVPVLAVADDRPVHEGVGGGPPQAPRVHRRGRRSAQPSPDGFLVRAARQRLPLPQGSQEHRRPRALRARHQGRLVGARALPARPARARDRHRRAVRRSSGPARACSRRASTPRCTCSCCRRRSTGCATTSGYRNFDNTATNLRFLALLTGGEGLHNNHHGFPRSPKFSFRASEIDPAWPVIRLLIALRPREAQQDHRRSRSLRVAA